MKEWSPEDWDYVKALYDGEIRSTDDGIGILLRGLEDRGLKHSTLLVFVSDHGQEFFEHGAYGHGHSLHAEVLRVPLIFEFPGKLPQARRVQQQVRLLDVTPTILTLLGVKAETKFEGANLVPLATGRGPAEASPGAALPATIAYSEGVRLGGEMKAITTPAWKVIHHVESGSTEVFDRRSDPGEAVSLRGDGNASRDAVRTLFGAMFSMTDSWHVEIRAGSHPHRLDIAISASRGPVTGEIGPVRVIDGAGMYRPLESVAGGAGAHAAIAIKELLVADSLDLVFKSSPHRYPVNFDFKFDGRPATEITFLGSELERPEGMPFVQTPGKATSKSRGEPSRRPVPPYVLVWLSGGKYGEEGAALSESSKRQLRALGYLE